MWRCFASAWGVQFFEQARLPNIWRGFYNGKIFISVPFVCIECLLLIFPNYPKQKNPKSSARGLRCLAVGFEGARGLVACGIRTRNCNSFEIKQQIWGLLKFHKSSGWCHYSCELQVIRSVASSQFKSLRPRVGSSLEVVQIHGGGSIWHLAKRENTKREIRRKLGKG